MKPQRADPIAHSVHDRLLKLATSRKEDFNAVLARYGIERLLYRLTCTPHVKRFVLKGAAMAGARADILAFELLGGCCLGWISCLSPLGLRNVLGDYGEVFHFQSQFTQWDLQGAANSEHRHQADFLITALDIANMIAVYSGQLRELFPSQTGVGTHAPQGVPEGHVRSVGLFVQFLVHARKLGARWSMVYRLWTVNPIGCMAHEVRPGGFAPAHVLRLSAMGQFR